MTSVNDGDRIHDIRFRHSAHLMLSSGGLFDPSAP